MILRKDGGGDLGSGRASSGDGPRKSPPKDTGGSKPPGAGTVTPIPPALPSVQPLTAQRIADLIKGGLTETAPAKTIQDFLTTCVSVSSHFGISWTIAPSSTNLQAAQSMRSSVMTALKRASDVAAIAATRGFLLPDDTMPRFLQLNATRQLFGALGIPAQEENDLVAFTLELVKIAVQYDSGRVTFLDHLPAAQLAAFEVSVDGISRQSGDPLVDILGYQPDADFIKRKQALESLARLDFSKRKPYLLFTADVVTRGKRDSGTVICWTRMRDASGYIVTKRDVFSGMDFQPAAISNDDVHAMTDALMGQSEFRQVLSFYDWVHPGDAVAFLDSSSQPGTLYSYTVSGVQHRAPSTQFIFDVPMSSLYLSPAQAEMVKSIISADTSALSSSPTIDSVSPYPALAKVVYGDPGYGWILAGCNVLAGQRRGDSTDDIRSTSYIGSKASFLLAQAAAGRLFVPTDVGQIHSAIDAGISSFGVSQVVLAVLDGTGVTLFSSQKDDPLGFQPTHQSLQGTTGGLAKILAAVDPESAILDPHVLAATLATHVNSGGQTRYSPSPVLAVDPRTQVVTAVNRTIAVVTTQSLESAFGQGVIDLTTYEGISKLMQLIRTIYDFYPGALV